MKITETSRRGVFNLIPDELKDHVPVLYAIHIWNNLVND